jgi:hypothetical protein
LFTLSGAWAIRRIKSGYVPITAAILRKKFWQIFLKCKNEVMLGVFNSQICKYI